MANSLCKLEVLLRQMQRKLQIQEFRLGFDSISHEAARNVFSKRKNDPKAVESEDKKKKGSLKKEMSIVKEEAEEEDTSPQRGKTSKEPTKSKEASNPSISQTKGKITNKCE